MSFITTSLRQESVVQFLDFITHDRLEVFFDPYEGGFLSFMWDLTDQYNDVGTHNEPRPPKDDTEEHALPEKPLWCQTHRLTLHMEQQELCSYPKSYPVLFCRCATQILFRAGFQGPSFGHEQHCHFAGQFGISGLQRDLVTECYPSHVYELFCGAP